MASYSSQLDSMSSLSLRDELIVKFVKTDNILKANNIKIEIYQDLLKARFELRDNSDLLDRQNAYDDEYHKDFYKRLHQLKDKIYINEMYINYSLYETFLYIIIALIDLTWDTTLPQTRYNFASTEREKLHLNAQLDQQFVAAMKDIRKNQKTDLTLTDVDIDISEEAIIKKMKKDILKDLHDEQNKTSEKGNETEDTEKNNN